MLRKLLPAVLAVLTLARAPAVWADDEAPAKEEGDLPELAARSDDPFLQRLEGYRADARAKARTPEAALPLLRAISLKDQLPSLAPLASLYAEFSEKAGVNPEVRALARYLLAHVEKSRGRLPRADEQLQKLGFVTKFRIAGPFDNEGKRGCDTALPPETSIDLGAKFAGKAREISWRRLPELAADGYIDLGSVMRPTNETLTYAHTVLDSPSDQRVVVHLGASGASRMWLNGTKIASDDTYHPPRLDQVQVAVNLRKGPNQLLLKICEESGPYGFFLRLSGKNGEPLENVTASTPDTLPAIARGPKVEPELQPTLVEVFRKRAEAAKDDARARADYAEMLHSRRTFDSKDRRDAAEAARAAKLAPRDADILMLAARIEDENSNIRRAFREQALAVDPSRVEATLTLVDYQLAHGFPRKALELIAAAKQKSPNDYRLTLAEARCDEELGMPVTAQRLVEALGATRPSRFEVVKELARIARRSERHREAVSLYRVALSVRFDDKDSRRALAGILADLGDVEGALREQRELNALEPWDAFNWLRLGELAAANDLPEEARKGFARAREILPDEGEIFEREGKALARLGDKPGAQAAFERALVLKPQNSQVKEALKALRGEEKGFGEQWAQDASRLLAAPQVPGEDAVVLHELNAVKVFASGMSSRYVQQVIRVQTARGVEAERSQWINYSPDRQELKILKARVFRPDGAVLESHNDSDRSLSDNASKLYYDARARIISFPNLAPGDVLELSYRLDDTANDNLLSDYFGDVHPIQGGSPKSSFEYVLSAPRGRTIYSNTIALERLSKSEEPQPDGTTLYRWKARDVPRLISEPGMPGYAEIAPMIHVSTYKDWDGVGKYYWGLIRDQLVPNEEVREAVKDALAAAKVQPGDDMGVVKAVYDFVVSRTRYVGLEFGIHGYKPYKVDKVLSRRFGDCKDKASLMHAMMKVAGVDSRLVLLRMRRLGKLDPSPASLAAFNHAILYVPKFDLYLDGTAEFYGSRELPTEDRGAEVLVIQPDGGSKIGQIPDAKAEQNAVHSEYEVTLDASGKATLKGKTRVNGVSAPDYRRSYAAASTRKQTWEAAWSRSFPGLAVKELELSDLTDIEKEVIASFTLEVPRYAVSEDAGLAFSPFGQGRTYVESYAPLSERKQDLVLAYPWSNGFTYRYTLPKELAAAELPTDVDVKSPYGEVVLKYRSENGQVVCEGQVMLGSSRVTAAEYPAFRAFLGSIDQALARKVKLGKAAVLPKSAGL